MPKSSQGGSTRRLWGLGCSTAVILLIVTAFSILRPRSLVDGLAPEDRATIRHPELIEIIRIAPDETPSSLDAPGNVLANEKQTLPPVIADQHTRNTIVKAFEDASYVTVGTPRCEPQPGLLFRFTRDSRTVEVLFCGSCGAAYVYPPGARTASEHYVLNVQKAVVEVARHAFPKDEALQGSEF